MPDPDPSRPAPIAGGALIAFALLAGTIVGAIRGEPSMGFLIGLVAGVAAALALWLIDRSRRR